LVVVLAAVVLRDTLVQVAVELADSPQAVRALAAAAAAAPVISFAFHVFLVATMVALAAEVLVY
jgi:hypothetical protein